jgi:hypothetical protein
LPPLEIRNAQAYEILKPFHPPFWRGWIRLMHDRLFKLKTGAFTRRRGFYAV